MQSGGCPSPTRSGSNVTAGWRRIGIALLAPLEVKCHSRVYQHITVVPMHLDGSMANIQRSLMESLLVKFVITGGIIVVAGRTTSEFATVASFTCTSS